MSGGCEHDECHDRWYRKRLWIIIIVAFITVNILIIVTIYLILRPIKTNFNLQNASVFTFNVTSPPNSLLSSTLQVTISASNPNDQTGIYYDCVDVFATYKNQQITLATDIPPFYQRHNDVTVWSPYLSGVAIPLAPYVAECLAQDQSSGLLLLVVKVDAQIRWKVGALITRHSHLSVTCPALLSLHPDNGVGDPLAIKLQQISNCNVDD